ncbi:MAG: DNA polymerase IV [Chloroflexota bacterium]|nr:DNA polymerase IV [Chloroflexota bacterium]
MFRKILHLDLDAFYCAVEENDDPSLRGLPFAVGGHPEGRGVVASCSYPARAFGVRSAMPMSRAIRLCPDLIIRRARFDAYSAASRAVMARLHDLTPDVEQISIDEAFLDVTLLPEDAESIAHRLQVTINGELRLPCSLGVASNKLVAKIANNIGKDRAGKGAPPNAITVVAPGQEAAFLAPLPVRELWGVGPKTADTLYTMGMTTIGDLARYSQAGLTARFGKHGADLARYARGIDTRAVESEGDAKSISKETTFARDVMDVAQLEHTLRGLADEVGRKLRADGLHGATVKLKLRWADFTTLTRQVTLPQPTQHDSTIYEAARGLLHKVWVVGKAARLIGVGVSGFEDAPVQRSLWDDASDAQQTKLENALDDLRDRFGKGVVKRGSELE